MRHLSDLLIPGKVSGPPNPAKHAPSYLGVLTFDGVDRHLYSDGTLLPVIRGGSVDSPPDALPRLLTVRQFCETYQVSRTRAFALIKSGELPSVLAGGPKSRRIPAEAAEEWMRSLAADRAS